MKKRKALYFYTAESPFVEKDRQILSEKFNVVAFRFNIYKKGRLTRILLSQLLFLLRERSGTSLVVCQFAGLHALLPVCMALLFRKKSIIVAGGTDCVSFPSIRYGNFSRPVNAWITRTCFQFSKLILPVHSSLVLYEYTYQDNDHPRQGIRYFMPRLKTPIRVIHNGYDSVYWRNTAATKEKNSFITVLGHVNSRFTSELKGIDLFVEAARHFPDCKFTIIGGTALQLNGRPANLHLPDNIWGPELIGIFSAHEYYMQLSMSEGFPNALSEAMLCECVPIVSRVGGMPEIVGDTGFILDRREAGKLFELMRLAMGDTDTYGRGQKARARVAANYTFEKRKKEMLEAVQALVPET